MTEAMVDDALVEATPEDREAAIRHLEHTGRSREDLCGRMIRDGWWDHNEDVQAFARHRLAGVAAGREEAARYLEAEAEHYRHAQDNANSPGNKLYRMGQKDACLLEATAIRQRGE